MADDGGSSPRPRQVTFPAVLALSGCVVLVLSMFEAMAGVRSVETRELWEEALGQPPLSGTGIDVDGVLRVLPTLVTLNAALGAAGAVLAFYVLRRQRRARTWLAVVAGALLLSSFMLSQLSVLIAVGAALLWSRDATDWLEGRTPRPRSEPAPSRPAAPSAPPAPASSAAVAQPSAEERAGWPPPEPRSAAPPPSAWAPPQRPAAASSGRPDPRSRPRGVVAAVWLTWLSCALTVGLCVELAVRVAARRSELVAGLPDMPQLRTGAVTEQQLVVGLWVVAGLGVAWSVGAMVLAAFAYRGGAVARILLVVSAVLAATLAAPFLLAGWPQCLVAFAVAVLLLLPTSNRWYGSTLNGSGRR